uniref:Uncharacterized protein n=1 Tax=Cyanothece sp. (strain PCC 7425 / ATCC 29141) TaxID=395961 RepID=B8HMZ6_CYAP4
MTNLQLRIALDPESVKQVQALAVYPEVRGDHVTLAHVPISQPINPVWFPQGYYLGDRSGKSRSNSGSCSVASFVSLYRAD